LNLDDPKSLRHLSRFAQKGQIDMAKRETQKYEREMAALVGARDFIERRLTALMPTATRINGDPEGQMHLSVVDQDSQRAAEVTLEKFASAVDVFNVMDVQMYIHFRDEDQADEAISFYNRLPAKMAKFKPA
jgi:hypothetical protein